MLGVICRVRSSLGIPFSLFIYFGTGFLAASDPSANRVYLSCRKSEWRTKAETVMANERTKTHIKETIMANQRQSGSTGKRNHCGRQLAVQQPSCIPPECRPALTFQASGLSSLRLECQAAGCQHSTMWIIKVCRPGECGSKKYQGACCGYLYNRLSPHRFLLPDPLLLPSSPHSTAVLEDTTVDTRRHDDVGLQRRLLGAVKTQWPTDLTRERVTLAD